MTTTAKPLTVKQQAVLDFIRQSIRKNQRPPTIRELMAEFGFRSPNAVAAHVKPLIHKGYLQRHEYGGSRNLFPVELDKPGVQREGDHFLILGTAKPLSRGELIDLAREIDAVLVEDEYGTQAKEANQWPASDFRGGAGNAASTATASGNTSSLDVTSRRRGTCCVSVAAWVSSTRHDRRGSNRRTDGRGGSDEPQPNRNLCNLPLLAPDCQQPRRVSSWPATA